MKRILSVVFSLLVIAAYGETFTAGNLYSIDLPDEWREIPNAELNPSSEGAEIAHESYDFGYQLDGSGKWLSFPYILVKEIPCGRLSSAKAEWYAEGQAGNKGFVEGISSGGLRYDKDNQILWSILELKRNGDSTVKAIIALKQTETGLIRLMGCSAEEHFEELSGVFEKAFLTLKVDESVRYKPRMLDNMPIVNGVDSGMVVIWGVQGAGVGLALWLIYIFIKKQVAGRVNGSESEI